MQSSVSLTSLFYQCRSFTFTLAILNLTFIFLRSVKKFMFSSDIFNFYLYRLPSTQLLIKCFLSEYPPGGSEWIMSIEGYVDNSFTALGSSDPREVRLEL